jgi:ubiquinone/menaquinone biosynthesis C-methylase UbiE
MGSNFYGNGADRMPDNRFRRMAFFFKIRDIFAPHDYKLESFGIKNGDTVVDCGCGTGSCLLKASNLVGYKGTVYAVDIHEMAIQAAHRTAEKFKCINIKPVLSSVSSIPLPDECADCIYALDMFHMVSDSATFLKELHRITKKSGRLILEDGHQPRLQSKQKILASGVWNISEENKKWLVCIPKFQ